MSVRVAVAQFVPTKAQVAKNLDTIAEIMREASTHDVKLVVFPETITSGYFLEGGVLEAALTSEALRAELETRLQGLEKDLEVCLGFYENCGGHLFNSAALLRWEAGSLSIVGVYQKFFLPTYGVFDEERFVTRGRDLSVLDSRIGKIGILICEDVWHSILPTLVALKGAQVLLVPSSSPARGFTGETIENHDRYRRLLRSVAEEHGVYCVNAQLIGFEGGKGFLGGSMVIDPFGRTVGEAPLSDPHMLIADLDLDLVSIARSQTPLLSDLRSAWSDLRRIAIDMDAV